jgi:hypothetical protein
VADTPFELAIPGHGAPLNRAGFQQYRNAFDAFIACSNSTRAAADCAASWTDSICSLLGAAPDERERAREMASYYVGMLRANDGRSKYCQSVPQR